MSAEVVSPVSESYVGCCGGEVGLVGECGEGGVCVAGEADGVAVAAHSSPAVVDDGSELWAVLLHVVVEDVVAPEGLAESFHAWVGEVLLPVEPPEVYAFALS